MKTTNIKGNLTIIVLLLGALLVNCSKKDDENTPISNYHIEMKMNGEHKMFNKLIVAQINDDNGEIQNIVVSGLKDMDAGFSDGFDFTIMDLDEGITTKTYLNPVDRGNLNYELTSNFYNTSENLYFSSVYYDPEEFKITITNLNANYVEGTFSGKMKNLENQEIIDITDGRFFAPTRF